MYTGKSLFTKIEGWSFFPFCDAWLYTNNKIVIEKFGFKEEKPDIFVEVAIYLTECLRFKASHLKFLVACSLAEF